MNPTPDSVAPAPLGRRRPVLASVLRPDLASLATGASSVARRAARFAAPPTIRAIVRSVAVALIASLAIAGAVHAEGQPQPRLPTVQVLVGGVPLTAEIASGGEQRYMGLSFRESLAEDAGMLFVYPDERPLTFTMRNTLLPLSIAFIDEDLVVRQLVDMDVGPNQLFDSDAPARYALEVNQGWFERNGIVPGAVVTMP